MTSCLMTSAGNLRLLRGFFVVLFALNLYGCTSKPRIHTFGGETMGTTYQIKIYGTSVRTKDLQKKVQQRLILINNLMSTYQVDSEISLFNQYPANKPMRIHPMFGKVLSSAMKLSRETQGLFDPTVGPLVNLWGFGPKGKKNKPSSSEIQQALQATGLSHITLTQESGTWHISKDHAGTRLDLSSIAKGFAVDEIAQVLNEHDHFHYLIEIGGEMRAQGTKGNAPWVVGIEKPIMGQRAVMKTLELSQSLATSGNYRNYFTQDDQIYAHTINPTTGTPVQTTLLSVTVMHEHCMMADAYATALMAMGEKKALEYVKLHNLHVMMITGHEGQLLMINNGHFTNLEQP